MSHLRSRVVGLVIVAVGAFAGGAVLAQADKSAPAVDLKPFVPPVFPIPPNSQLNPGTVGGSETPYTTAPLQSPSQSSSQSQPAPGIRLSIPSR